MSSNALRSHKKSDMIKWILVLIVGIALIGAVIGLAVKLNRSTTDERLGSEAYSIGIIDEDGEIDKSEKTSIYTRNAIKVDGLTIELAKDAEVTYSLFFYNKKGKFVESKDYTTTDFKSADVPEGATSVRIVITPTDDDEITLTEIKGYANQLTVRFKK